MVKLVVLLNMYLFAWDTEVFWILMHCSNSEHSRKNGFSGEDLLIFMGY